ncbi:MAG: hypothetical protein ACR2LA_11220 [Acidimicrobiales bacterium]
MANKREPASQKRQRLNRAQREALAARKTAASTPRPSRQPPVAARRTGGEAKAPPSRPDEAAAPGAKAGRRARRVRPPRPGDVPVDVDTLEGSFYRRVIQVPGGSQAAQGFFLAVAAVVFSVVLAFLVHTVPAAGTSSKDRNAVGVDTAISRYGPVVLLPLLVILAVATLGFVYSLRPQRRRIWLVVAVVTGVFVFIGQILFVFVAGMFAYAVMRSSKVEGPNEPLFGARRRSRAAAPEGTDGALDATAREVGES